jgi:sec-independent protein translocase protein TatA
MELFSPGHLIPLLIVVGVLFFGWKQLPDMARSVGKSLRIFKTEMKGMSEDDQARDGKKVIEQKAEPDANAGPEAKASTDANAGPEAKASTEPAKVPPIPADKPDAEAPNPSGD